MIHAGADGAKVVRGPAYSRLALAVAAGLFLCGQSPPATDEQEPVMIDGAMRPNRSETGSNFHCGGLNVELRYREEERPLAEVGGLDEALQVTLLDLSVSGRHIRAAERAKAEALFRTFAWVDSADMLCFAGRARLRIWAMSTREWVDFIEERAPQRPRARVRTIDISRQGLVTIDGPGF